MDTEQRDEQLKEWAAEQKNTERGEDGSGCIGYWNLCQCPRCQNID